MAFLTTKPNFAVTMPDLPASGVALLNSITAKKIWLDGSLQYFLGDNTTLNLDSEFRQDVQSMFGRVVPDAVFAFETVTDNAFRAIDAVTALDFSRTFAPADADQVIISVDKPASDTEGFFDFPGTAFHDDSSGTDSWSIGAFNSGIGYMLQAPEFGGGEYANWTVIHEIGHSLGLKHTHNEFSGKPLGTIGKFMDNEIYSVMSYNPASGGTKFGHAVSMMALDIAALQALYGVETYAEGDSSYTLLNAMGGALDLTEGDVAIGRAYYSIWDSGGTDTIDYGNLNQSVLINLNDATINTAVVSADLKAMFSQLKLSNFYKDLSVTLQREIVDKWHHAGGFFSHVLTQSGGDYKAIAGGFSIAHGAVIENGTGGNASDLLIGNEAGNRLTGLDGNDTMLGASGEDTLTGGTGIDRLDGGFGNDILTGGAGEDRFVFSNRYGTDTIADFARGDIIDLSRLTDFSSFKDLRDNHMFNSSGSVVISVGDDTLILLGHSKADLLSTDFII